MSGSLVFTTDYFFRGYSKSDGKPAAQANLDYEHASGFYLGAWVASVDFGDSGSGRARVEMTPYVGWSVGLLEEWRFDVSFSRYIYDGTIFGSDSDYNELNAQISFGDLVTARFAWSDDFYQQGAPAYDIELTGRYPLTDAFELSGGIGLSEANEALEYNYIYWNLGATWFFKYAALDLRYTQAKQFAEKVKHNPWPFDPPSFGTSLIFSASIGF